MVHDEMLRALLDLAEEHGWEYAFSFDMMSDAHVWGSDTGHGLIFEHDFAKAVYGDTAGICSITGRICEWNSDDGIECIAHFEAGSCERVMNIWKYHLQYQSLSDDPLKYMYENRRKV